MKKLLALCVVLIIAAASIEDAVDVTLARIELPYASTVWIKKRVRNGHSFATDLSDPNLQFVTDTVVDNFEYFEIKCRVCAPMQEIMLILREVVPSTVFDGEEPEIRAYNVYVV